VDPDTCVIGPFGPRLLCVPARMRYAPSPANASRVRATMSSLPLSS
jgi:hypothetical protein